MEFRDPTDEEREAIEESLREGQGIQIPNVYFDGSIKMIVDPDEKPEKKTEEKTVEPKKTMAPAEEGVKKNEAS